MEKHGDAHSRSHLDRLGWPRRPAWQDRTLAARVGWPVTVRAPLRKFVLARMGGRYYSIPLSPVCTSGTGVPIPLFPMCVHRLKHAVQQNAPRFTLFQFELWYKAAGTLVLPLYLVQRCRKIRHNCVDGRQRDSDSNSVVVSRKLY